VSVSVQKESVCDVIVSFDTLILCVLIAALRRAACVRFLPPHSVDLEPVVSAGQDSLVLGGERVDDGREHHLLFQEVHDVQLPVDSARGHGVHVAQVPGPATPAAEHSEALQVVARVEDVLAGAAVWAAPPEHIVDEVRAEEELVPEGEAEDHRQEVPQGLVQGAHVADEAQNVVVRALVTLVLVGCIDFVSQEARGRVLW